MISNYVKFLLNDKLIVINNPDPNQTILNYIRTELKKTGTKEGCSEGGCGACTIVLGELADNEIEYKAINSCISFVPSLNGKQLIIVEDLVSENGKLHPVQRHKLPDIESVINSLLRFLLFLNIENKAITNPGVQKPHWEP